MTLKFVTHAAGRINVVLCGKSLREQPVVGPQGCMSMACGHDRVDEKKHGQQLSTFDLEYLFLKAATDGLTYPLCARARFRMRTRVCLCACVINVSIRKLQPPLAARQHALQR